MMFNYSNFNHPIYNNNNNNFNGNNYQNSSLNNNFGYKQNMKNESFSEKTYPIKRNLTNNYSYNNNSKQQNEHEKYDNNKQKLNSDHINLLGIDLYFDDVLLILLIYFLYTEGIKDIYLFITLTLLLLT